MADKKLFRISLLGGFNKKEVETYVRQSGDRKSNRL